MRVVVMLLLEGACLVTVSGFIPRNDSLDGMEFDSLPPSALIIKDLAHLGGSELSILPMPNLGPEERAVEDRAIELVKTKSRELITEYRARFGNHVGTDLARELFPDYAVDLESRLRFAVAVQRSASAVADLVFDRILEQRQEGCAVLFTAGGTGAGKTSAINRNADTSDVFRAATAIFDGNFNSWKSSRDRVQKCLDLGYKVVIIFVHRHPVEAFFQGVIPRALVEGRTVSIESHLRMHKDSISTFLKANRLFTDNKSVSFVVLNNTGHELESHIADIDYLKSVKYDSVALKNTLEEELENALSKGQISQALCAASRRTSTV